MTAGSEDVPGVPEEVEYLAYSGVELAGDQKLKAAAAFLLSLLAVGSAARL